MKADDRVECSKPSPQAALRECVDQFAAEFVAGLMGHELHGPSSPKLKHQLAVVVRRLRDAVAEGADSPMEIRFCDRRLLWADQELLAATLQGGKLIDLANARGLSALRFAVGVDVHAIAALLELLFDDRAKDAFRPQAIDMVLRARGVRGIEVVLGNAASSAPGTGTVPSAERSDISRYQALAGVLQSSHVRAHRGNEIDLDQARGIVERTVAQMGSSPSDLLALAVYDDIDRFTVGHSVRVALLALQVARAAGASERDLLLVGTCGLLHDIGKSQVPQEVLFKQGQLDDGEWAAMAEHPRLGAEILLEQRGIDPAAIGAAYCHHMAPQGHGYPRPPLRFEPSGMSKLVRVCDVFEALTAVRPYKRELTPLEALAIMHREATGFDSGWFRFFVQTIGIYPIGTRVRLTTGERALVVRQGVAIDRPVVRLIESATADDLPTEDARELTIGDSTEGRTHGIAAVIRRHHDGSDSLVRSATQHACLHPDHSHSHL